MALIPCRGCGHKVDRSALACPQCGATDPAWKISRQVRNMIISFVQYAIFFGAFAYGALYVRDSIIPKAREFLNRPHGVAEQNASDNLEQRR